MCSGPSYEALHQTHQQIETESHPQVGGIRTVVSQLSDQQQTIEYVALASAQVVDTFGHHRFHHLHHRYFNCNYGNPEIPFDKWFKTYNDGTKEATNKLLRN